MKALLRFFSLTTGTQICLALSQLLVLPLQLRLWGQATTSHWFVVLAIANLASVADLGLRMAGHSQLLASVRTGERTATEHIREVWAVTRLLIAGSTAVLAAVQLGSALANGRGPELWACAVTAATALDTLTIIRGMWLDTLGHFNQVEALFLGLVASRLVLSFAILLAHGQPALLASMMLLTGAAAAALQGRLMPVPPVLGLDAGGFRTIRWHTVALVRFVVAEPASNWVRLSLPVIVLSALATPRFTTTYVALRAIFGLARQVVSQLGRYASVSYVQRLAADPAGAQTLLIRFTLLSTLVGLAVACGVIADHARLMGVWLAGIDPATESLIALCFTAAAISYGYQVVAGVLMRSGDLAGVARRQYAYLIVSAAAAAGAYAAGSAELYLALLGLQELTIAGLFVGAASPRVLWASLGGFAIAAVLSTALWAAAALNAGELFATLSAVTLGSSLGLGGATVLVAAMAYAGLDLRLRRPSHRAVDAAASASRA